MVEWLEQGICESWVLFPAVTLPVRLGKSVALSVPLFKLSSATETSSAGVLVNSGLCDPPMQKHIVLFLAECD